MCERLLQRLLPFVSIDIPAFGRFHQSQLTNRHPVRGIMAHSDFELFKESIDFGAKQPSGFATAAADRPERVVSG